MPAHTSTEYRFANPRGRDKRTRWNFTDPDWAKYQERFPNTRSTSPRPYRPGNSKKPSGCSLACPRLFTRSYHKFYLQKHARESTIEQREHDQSLTGGTAMLCEPPTF